MFFVLILLVVTQQTSPCKDVEVCRAQALIAHASKDFEAFHDLAWAAHKAGKNNDTELMLLVARAQSLSGRPGDALVMLERIAALGGTTDAATSEDFVRVRALARWPEVEARLSAVDRADTEGSEPGKSHAAKTDAVKPDPPKPAPTKSEPAKSEPLKPEPSKTESRKPEPPKPEPPKTEASKAEAAKAAAGKPEPPKADSPREVRAAGAPLKFTTLLSPSSLAYDGVSKRFIIADREARRVAVIDENTGQVSTLVGAQGGLGDVGGIAIDTRQGDLWAISAGDQGSTLHKVQLISGRVLTKVTVKGIASRIVGLTFVRDSGLVAADAEGNLWRIESSGRAEKIGALEYVPRALTSDPLGRIYVSAGGPRLARYSVASGLRRVGVIELEDGIPSDTSFVVSAERLHAIVKSDGEYEIRSMRLVR